MAGTGGEFPFPLFTCVLTISVYCCGLALLLLIVYPCCLLACFGCVVIFSSPLDFPAHPQHDDILPKNSISLEDFSNG